jgi:hypothetical protein
MLSVAKFVNIWWIDIKGGLRVFEEGDIWTEEG